MSEESVVAKIFHRVRLLPGTMDLWLIAITLMYAFGRPIPWWAWLMIALEFLLVMTLGIRERMS